jgi:outer membrane receptor protein involved in Fe transport
MDTGVVTNTKTNNSGTYDLLYLPIGRYSVTVSKPGFETYRMDNIPLHLEAVTVNAALKVGAAASEVITVQASVAAASLESETSDLSTTLTEDVVEEIPVVGGTWFDAIGTAPGLNPGSGSSVGGNMSGTANGSGVGVNGAGAWMESWTVDGGQAMASVSYNTSNMTPISAISEVNLLTGNQSAEYGNGNATFNVMTKSGTNKFHGEAYDYNENTAFEARAPFTPANQPVNPLHWNEYGGNIGGPIWKNKAFFFFNYQDNPDNSNITFTMLVPTDEMKQGIFPTTECTTSTTCNPVIYDPASTTSTANGYTRTPFDNNSIPSSRFDPVAVAAQKYFVEPNIPGAAYGANNYYFTTPSPSVTRWYNLKFDYNVIPDRDHLSVSLSKTTNVNPQPYPWAWVSENVFSKAELVQISNVLTFSPSLLNETRFSLYNNQAGNFPSDSSTNYQTALGLKNLPDPYYFPGMYMNGLYGADLPTFAWDFYTVRSPDAQWADVVTLIRGKHALKFGGEFNMLMADNAWGNESAGQFNFSGGYTSDLSSGTPNAGGPVNGYADFLLGDVQSWGTTVTPETHARSWNAQAFALDDFKVTRKLTLNIGLRWAALAGWSEKNNNLRSFNPTLLNPATNTLGAMWYGGQDGRSALENTRYDAFSPRVGFSWSPDGNTTIRGAFGMFDMGRSENEYGQGMGYQGINQSLTDNTNLNPVFPLQQSNPPVSMVLTVPSSSYFNNQWTNYYPYKTPITYSEQWQLGIQRKLSNTVLLDVAYVANHQVHTASWTDFNQVTAANAALYGPTVFGPGGTRNMQPYTPYPQYQGITDEKFEGFGNYNSLQVQVKKSFSHGLNFMSSYTYGKALDTGTMSGWGNGPAPQNSYNIRGDYGRSVSDIRSLWNGMAAYQLPIGKGKAFVNRGGIVDSVVGGWAISTLWQVHSGTPFTPGWGGGYNNYSLYTGSIRPDRNGKCGKGVSTNRSVTRWFDTSIYDPNTNPSGCWSSPAAGTFGSGGRDILDGPGYTNVNASGSKQWSLPNLPHVSESASLQFRVDADNVFNHVELQNPNANIDSSNAGQINSAFAPRIFQAELVFKF